MDEAREQITQLQDQLANAHPRMAGELADLKQRNHQLTTQLQDARRKLVEMERDKAESERRLRTAGEKLSRERDELLAELEKGGGGLTAEKRDRILAALGVGRQSAQYKRVKMVLDQMMP